MKRSFSRVLLAGVSPLAILVMTAGSAWAGAGDGLIVDTTADTMTNANSGTSYSSGILTVSGTQTGVGDQNGLHFQGDGSAIPALVVNINANVTAGNSLSGPGIPVGVNVWTTGGTYAFNVASGVTVSSPVGSGFAINDSNVTSLINRGTIIGSDRANTNAIGLGNAGTGQIDTLTNYGTITSASSSSTISAHGGAAINTINNESGGTISNTGGGAAISLGAMASGTTITNNGTISGDIRLGAGGTSYVRLNAGSSFAGELGPNASTTYVSVGHSGSGTATFRGSMGDGSSPIESLTVTNGATLAISGDSEIYSKGITFYSNSTFDIGTHKLTWSHASGGSENISQTFILKTTINANTGQHGYWVFDGMSPGTMFTSGVPVITPTVIGTVAAGSKYVIVQDTAGRTVVNTPSVVNSGGYRWTVSQVTGTGQTDTDGVSYGTDYTNIVITADRQNAAGTATGTNGAGVKALATYSGSDAGLQALSQAVNNLTNASDIKKAGAQLRPETTGNTAQASMGAVTQALSTIQVRTDAVRVAASETGTGVSSGETLKGLGVWGQGFGSTASQGDRNDVSGYDADTYGLAFGADFKVIDPLRVGLSFAYAKTNVDSTGDRSGSGQDIGSYITSLYGTYSGKGWYVDGALTYGIHKYDATRHVAIAGAAAQDLKASYDGQQYGAKAEVGVPLAVGPAVVTPLASLAYNNLKQDAYSETGGAAALQVGASSTDSIRSGLGAKVSAKVATIGNWEVSPNARAVWHHEFNKSSQEQTSAYVAGGSSFTTPGSDIATEHFNLGLGVDVASVRNTTVSAKYDADLADKYVSHSASLQLRTEF